MSNKELNRLIAKAIECSNNGNYEEFEHICDYVTQQCKVEQMITFVQHTPNVDIDRFGLIVRTIGNAKDNFDYANIDAEHSNLYRDIIIASGDIESNLKAGKLLKDDYREEYVNKHGAIVLNGTPYQNFKYLQFNKAKTLNRKAHFDMIIASKNSNINYLCVKELEDIDILAHGQVIIDSGDVIQNLNLAKINGSDTMQHLSVIYTRGDAFDNMEVLRTFKDCCKIKHIERIFSLDDDEIKLECLQWLKSNSLLEKVKNLDYVSNFIEDYRNGLIHTENSQNSLK